jgi:dTDP-glucose 4,6-dehydratase
LRILVTGGAGFVGSAFVQALMSVEDISVLVLDIMSYAANEEALVPFADHPNFRLVTADICDQSAVRQALRSFEPDAVVNLAAETHVDRSIDSPQQFVRTNVLGTGVLLEESHAYWRMLPAGARERFRFHQVSTDEVFGPAASRPFTEEASYNPSSPYAASKAGADHLVRAWGRTYGLPVLITFSTNNYGPWQFPEKLIPLVLVKALNRETIPIYGDGTQRRDWLHVEDHVAGILAVLLYGSPGQSYCIAAGSDVTNLEVVRLLLQQLDRKRPAVSGSYESLIQHVEDRPGHDQRYALDATKVEAELGWRCGKSLKTGLADTIDWYLENESWWRGILERTYDGKRLGLDAQRIL